MRRFVAALLITALGIVLAEMGLRLLSLFPADSPLYVNDPAAGFRLRPHLELGSLRTNALGFNDDERCQRPKRGPRVAVIGDSFVFGVVPRRDNLVSALQRAAKARGMAVAALNLGLPGAGPQRYRTLLTLDAVRCDADLVYLLLFVGNDITQAHPDFRTAVWLGAPRQLLRTPYRLGGSLEYLYTYRLLRALLRFLRAPGAEEEGFGRENYLAIQRQRSAVYRREPKPLIREGLAAAIAALREMAAIAHHQGQEFVVVLAPAEIQIDVGLQAEVVERFGLDPDRFDFSEPQARLSRALLQAEIPVIDLLPDLRGAAAEGPLYLTNDSHWNALGNRLVGERLARDLLARQSQRGDPTMERTTAHLPP